MRESGADKRGLGCQRRGRGGRARTGLVAGRAGAHAGMGRRERERAGPKWEEGRALRGNGAADARGPVVSGREARAVREGAP